MVFNFDDFGAERVVSGRFDVTSEFPRCESPIFYLEALPEFSDSIDEKHGLALNILSHHCRQPSIDNAEMLPVS